MPEGDMLAAIGGLGFDWGDGEAVPWGAGPLGSQPLLLLIGLLAEAAIGGLPWLWRRVPHPIALLGRLIARLDRQLNREERGAASRKSRGLLVAVSLIVLAGLLGWAIQLGARAVSYGWLAELAVIVVLLAQRSLFDHVRAVTVALNSGGLAAGRAAVRHIVGRDVDRLDEYGVARAAIESCAENFSDAVVAPSLWYLLFGLPGLLIYKTINTMDSMIGYRTARHRDFGRAAARIDDGANYLPARLAGLVIVFAAGFTPGAAPRRAWRVMRRDARNHASPNSGWPEAAMAGALGLALGGPRPYHGVVEPAPWIGDGVARATPGDIRRALYLYRVACLINMGLVAGFALLMTL